jgi:hypothetical protein
MFKMQLPSIGTVKTYVVPYVRWTVNMNRLYDGKPVVTEFGSEMGCTLIKISRKD